MVKDMLDIPFHYFNQTFDAKLPVVITKFESMTEGDAQADYPHRHDWYELLIVTQGEGQHIVDFSPYTVEPPVCFFLSPDQVHHWQLTKPLEGYALLFTEEFLGFPSSNFVRAHDFAFFHHVGQAPYLSIRPESFAMINGLLIGMTEEFNQKNARSFSVLRAYLHILLTQLHRLYVAEHPDAHSLQTSSLVRQFKQLVSEHFITDHTVQDYAKRIGISTSHLTDTIKTVTGHTPGHIIRQKLSVEAKRLLAHSSLTAAEIGYQLNFDDSSYFGRFFKRETGMSPSKFRQSVKGKNKIPK